jgi:hypothetical protein
MNRTTTTETKVVTVTRWPMSMADEVIVHVHIVTVIVRHHRTSAASVDHREDYTSQDSLHMNAVAVIAGDVYAGKRMISLSR